MGKRVFYFVMASACVLGALHGLASPAKGVGSAVFVGMSEGRGTDGEYWLAGTLAITADGEVYFRPEASPHGVRWIHESALGVSGVVAMSRGRGQDGTTGTRVLLQDGSLYFRREDSGATWTYDSHIGANEAAAIAYGRGTSTYLSDLVVTRSGAVYARPDAYPCCNTWRLDSNILEQATEASRESWGWVKARYRR